MRRYGHEPDGIFSIIFNNIIQNSYKLWQKSFVLNFLNLFVPILFLKNNIERFV